MDIIQVQNHSDYKNDLQILLVYHILISDKDAIPIIPTQQGHTAY